MKIAKIKFNREDTGTGEVYNSIQCLRGIAALSVLLYHQGALSIGYAGVDIFFVISGFIMGTIEVGESPREFLAKRVIRIVPLYWAVTLFMCFLTLIPGATNTFTFSAATLAKSLFFVPYLNENGKLWPLVVAGWTLNYEMFFYVIFALGLVFGRTRLVLPLMATLVCVGFIAKPNDPIAQTYTSPLLIEFSAGLLLAQFTNLRGMVAGLGLLASGVALFIFAPVQGLSEDQTFARILWVGVPAFLLVSGALAVERAGFWPRLQPAELMGDASFSLYLLHGIVIAFAHKFLHLPPLVNTLLVVAISIAAAMASYALFELPMARFLRARLLPRGTKRHWPHSAAD